MMKKPAYNVPSRIDCGLRSKRPRPKSLMGEYPEQSLKETGSSGEDSSKYPVPDSHRDPQSHKTTKASTGSRCLTPNQQRKILSNNIAESSLSAHQHKQPKPPSRLPSKQSSISNTNSSLYHNEQAQHISQSNKSIHQTSTQNSHGNGYYQQQANKKLFDTKENKKDYFAHLQNINSVSSNNTKTPKSKIKDEFSIKIDQKMDELQDLSIKDMSRYKQQKFDRLSDRRKRELEQEKLKLAEELESQKRQEMENRVQEIIMGVNKIIMVGETNLQKRVKIAFKRVQTDAKHIVIRESFAAELRDLWLKRTFFVNVQQIMQKRKFQTKLLQNLLRVTRLVAQPKIMPVMNEFFLAIKNFQPQPFRHTAKRQKSVVNKPGSAKNKGKNLQNEFDTTFSPKKSPLQNYSNAANPRNKSPSYQSNYKQENDAKSTKLTKQNQQKQRKLESRQDSIQSVQQQSQGSRYSNNYENQLNSDHAQKETQSQKRVLPSQATQPKIKNVQSKINSGISKASVSANQDLPLRTSQDKLPGNKKNQRNERSVSQNRLQKEKEAKQKRVIKPRKDSSRNSSKNLNNLNKNSQSQSEVTSTRLSQQSDGQSVSSQLAANKNSNTPKLIKGNQSPEYIMNINKKKVSSSQVVTANNQLNQDIENGDLDDEFGLGHSQLVTSNRKESNFSFQELVDQERQSSDVPLPFQQEILPQKQYYNDLEGRRESHQEHQMNPFKESTKGTNPDGDQALQKTYDLIVENVRYSKAFAIKAQCFHAILDHYVRSYDESQMIDQYLKRCKQRRLMHHWKMQSMKPVLKPQGEFYKSVKSLSESLAEGSFDELALEFLRFKRLPKLFFTWYALAKNSKKNKVANK